MRPLLPGEGAGAAPAGGALGIRPALPSGTVLTGIALLVVLVILGTILTPGFLAPENLLTIGALGMLLVIASCGQTLVVVSGSGGIDLSVGSIISLAAVLGSQLMVGNNALLIPAGLAVLLVGAVLGALSGAGIWYFRIPPLVMTLGMAGIADGLALVVTQGQPHGSASPILAFLGSGHVLGVPVLLPLGLVVALGSQFLLTSTGYGRMLLLCGSNRQAAATARVPVASVVVGTYALSGVYSALAGLVLLGYTITSYLNTGSPYTLPSIAAVVVGGTPLVGGQGSFGNTVLGALIITIINTILVGLHMAEGGREVVDGAILLAVLGAYGLRSRMRPG